MNPHYNINWQVKKFEREDTLKYIFFLGHTNKQNEAVGKICVSQWFECPFTVDNITFKTAEHWMMAQKALLFSAKKTFKKIINCDKPAVAEKMPKTKVYHYPS
jgi:predicted NAD-dependent protein-ADP-ribosyltransferase YbiA (DUF1768 family)